MVFDDPADRLVSVAFTNVSTTDPQGFFQHPLNFVNTAPACALIALEPTVECDSFVTLGLECDRGGSTTDPDFDSTKFNTSGEVSGGWYNSAPSNGQGVPDANGRVMIARFSYKQNKNTSGDVCVFAQLAGSKDIVAFLLEPFDCSVPGGGLPASGSGTIWYVDDDPSATDGCCDDAASCNGWDDACPDLQLVLGNADLVSGHQVWVAEGTYRPTEMFDPPDARTATFAIPDDVGVYGGFEGTESTLQQRKKLFDTTILSGDIGVVGVASDNSYHVVMMGYDDNDAINVTLDGFKITAGNASAAAPPNRSAAGLLGIGLASSHIANCTFELNEAVCNAGGAEVTGGGLYTITDCTFRNNQARGAAGGLLARGGADFEIRGCKFESNSVLDAMGNPAGHAGGLFVSSSVLAPTATISKCQFIGNLAHSGGGAVVRGENVALIDCSFIANTAGGAEFPKASALFRGCAPVTVTNCLFAHNGPAPALESSSGCTVGADPLGCGLTWCLAVCNPDIPLGFDVTNSTFSDNAEAIKAFSPVVVENSTLWNNDAGISHVSTCDVSYSNVEGGVTSIGCSDGGGNIGELPAHEPTFSNLPGPDTTPGTSDDDFRTSSGSPGNDAGQNADVPPGVDKDLSGSPRFFDDEGAVDCEFLPGTCGTFPIVDMGAYEYGCNECQLDANGDGNIGAFDLAVVLGCWGPNVPGNGSCFCADANGDGSIGAFDLAVLLGSWGPCL